MKLTCDTANKMVKSLMADLDTVEGMERSTYTYSYPSNQKIEDVEIPDYSLSETSDKIDELNNKIFRLKHAVSVFNTTTQVPGFDFTMDEALVRLKVLTKRRNLLNEMRSMPNIRRDNTFRSSDQLITKPNFNKDDAEKYYRDCNDELMKLQQAINTMNLTMTFELDI